MFARQLPEANLELKGLVEEIQADPRSRALPPGRRPQSLGECPVLHHLADAPGRAPPAKNGSPRSSRRARRSDSWPSRPRPRAIPGPRTSAKTSKAPSDWPGWSPANSRVWQSPSSARVARAASARGRSPAEAPSKARRTLVGPAPARRPIIRALDYFLEHIRMNNDLDGARLASGSATSHLDCPGCIHGRRTASTDAMITMIPCRRPTAAAPGGPDNPAERLPSLEPLSRADDRDHARDIDANDHGPRL